MISSPTILYGWIGRTFNYISPYPSKDWYFNSEIINPQKFYLNEEGTLIYSVGEIIDGPFIYNQKYLARFKRQATRAWNFDVDVPSVRLYAVLWDDPRGDHPLWNYTLKEFNECL